MNDKLQVKLIAFDLDDTLLTDDRTISDENVDAIRECVKQGIYIVLCSGRAEAGILPFVRRLEIAGSEYGRYIAAINGCSIFDLHTRQQIYCKKVDPEILLEANRISEEWGLRTEVYSPDTIYYKEETYWTRLDVDLCKLNGVVVPDYEKFLEKGSTKMLIPGEPEILQKLQAELKGKFGNKAEIFTSKPYFLELLPPNCGKGQALFWLADHIHISQDTTMAFGDSMNDESMLRMCGYGVCMLNGLDEMKKISDFVTEKDNNNGGIADFLRKRVLK